MLRDINSRYPPRALPGLLAREGRAACWASSSGRAVTPRRRRSPKTCCALPDRRFFRRKGEPAWTMVGVDGETFTDVDEYLRYLSRHLPEAYMASRDLKMYAETLRKVAPGS